MSLLKSIRGTFKNVQDDITGSLKSLTVSPEKGHVPKSDLRVTSAVNYNAGADILHRNEKIWKDLYQFTEGTSKRAQDVDIEIGSMFVYCDRQSESLLRLHNEASRLPTLISQLQETTNSLALVEEEYDKVEAALVHLENVCEEQTFRKNVVAHHKQLTTYKMKKDHELQRFKVRLAAEHAHKVQQVNKKKQHLLHEKQAAFDEQFAKDVDFFKKHGKPGRLVGTPESEKKLDLSEIEIDEDPEALDAFLESADIPQTDVKDNMEEDAVKDNVEDNMEEDAVKDNVEDNMEEDAVKDNVEANIEIILDITSSSETELSPEVTVADSTNVQVIPDVTGPSESPEVTVPDTKTTNVQVIPDVTRPSESPEVTVPHNETTNVQVIPDVTEPPEVTVLDTETTNQSASATDLSTKESSPLEMNQSCSQTDSVTMTKSEDNDRIDTENHSSLHADSTGTDDTKQ